MLLPFLCPCYKIMLCDSSQHLVKTIYILFGTRASIIVYYWHTARLAAPTEPPGTDHTGEIISFSDVGVGTVGNPRAWYCYTGPGGVVWLDPGGNTLPIIDSNRDAVDNELFISGVEHTAVALHRGPMHYSPDGEHCCVRTNNHNERRCVTFSES